MYKNIITIILILAGIIGLSLLAKNSEESEGVQRGNALLKIQETKYDFGHISMRNGNVTKEFIVKNETDNDVTISNITTSCMCTVVYVLKDDGTQKGPFGMQHGGGYPPQTNELIGTNETRTLKVVFDPNAHGPAGIGPVERQILIKEKTGGQTIINIKATVTP